MTQLLKSISECEEKVFSLLDCAEKPWRCFLTLVSYCCDILKARNTPTVLHQSAVSRLCARCLSTAICILDFRRRVSRNVEQTKAVRIYTKEKFKEAESHGENCCRCKRQSRMERGKQALRSFLLSSSESFLNQCNLVPRNKSLYSLFTFEPLHNLHLKFKS